MKKNCKRCENCVNFIEGDDNEFVCEFDEGKVLVKNNKKAEDYFYCKGEDFRTWDELDGEIEILEKYCEDSNYKVGDQVVAIEDYKMDKITIYGMGTLLKENCALHPVKIDDEIVNCPIICKVEDWCELVDETDAEVKRIKIS